MNHHPLFTRPKPLVIAHRGAKAHSPENTLAAFRLALEIGADGGDMDAFRTSFRQLMSLYVVVNTFNGNSSSQRAVKPLMNALGLPGGAVRAPMLPINDKDLAAMVKAVLAIGIPELANIQPNI